MASKFLHFVDDALCQLASALDITDSISNSIARPTSTILLKSNRLLRPFTRIRPPYAATSSPSKRHGCERAGGAGPMRLFLLPIGIELLEKCDKIVGLLFVLQAGIDHLGARDFRLRVLDVFAEGGLIPSDPGILVSGRI